MVNQVSVCLVHAQCTHKPGDTHCTKFGWAPNVVKALVIACIFILVLCDSELFRFIDDYSCNVWRIVQGNNNIFRRRHFIAAFVENTPTKTPNGNAHSFEELKISLSHSTQLAQVPATRFSENNRFHGTIHWFRTWTALHLYIHKLNWARKRRNRRLVSKNKIIINKRLRIKSFNEVSRALHRQNKLFTFNLCFPLFSLFSFYSYLSLSHLFADQLTTAATTRQGQSSKARRRRQRRDEK